MRPDRTEVERTKILGDIGDRKSGPLIYRYTFSTGEQVILPARNVLHIPGFGFDGIKGYSPVRMAREAIGLGLSTEEFGARFFGEGTHPGGIVEHPNVLTETAHANLLRQLTEKHAGLGRSHRLMLLEEGMKWQQVGIPPEDAQFLQTREYQLEEVARIYRMQMHKIAALKKSTNNNIEQQALEFVSDTMLPWLIRWESFINFKLFTEKERKKYYVKFNVAGLLRGDIQSRYRAYATGRQWGWLSADDIRELEDMNPLPEGQGKQYMIPMNMRPANQAGYTKPQKANGGEKDEKAASAI
jgi:HK97 family phage portal protein